MRRDSGDLPCRDDRGEESSLTRLGSQHGGGGGRGRGPEPGPTGVARHQDPGRQPEEVLWKAVRAGAGRGHGGG